MYQCRRRLPDPEWKFAVFLRNPAERLLSAYLDKVNGTKRDKDHFLKLYNKTESPTFEEFVRIISQNRVDFELASKTQEKLQGVDWCKYLICLLLLLKTTYLDTNALSQIICTPPVTDPHWYALLLRLFSFIVRFTHILFVVMSLKATTILLLRAI